MPRTILRNSLILLTLSLYIAVTMQNDNVQDSHNQEHIDNVQWDDDIITLVRTKRGIKKVGFFKTLFSVVGEQYTDTKNTLDKVGSLINDNFLPENTTTEAPKPDSNGTTPAYKITRSELNRIISRNIKGLNRLFQIELRDAVRQSKISRREYDKNISKEISKFL